MLRVTQVLEPFLGLDKIPAHYLAAAADRGTRVHQVLYGNLIGLPPLHIEDDIAGYLTSYDDWAGYGHAVHLEERYECQELGISGQVDVIAPGPDGGLWVIDYKTSAKPSKAWPLQLSAYRELARRNGIETTGAAVLHLQRDGRPAKWLPQPDAWELYKSCLEAYKYFFIKKGDSDELGWEHI